MASDIFFSTEYSDSSDKSQIRQPFSCSAPTYSYNNHWYEEPFTKTLRLPLPTSRTMENSVPREKFDEDVLAANFQHQKNPCCHGERTYSEEFEYNNDLAVQDYQYSTRQTEYFCILCDQYFGRRSTLLRHMKLHSGEKDFICKQCDKAFTRKDILIRHTKSARCKAFNKLKLKKSIEERQLGSTDITTIE